MPKTKSPAKPRPKPRAAKSSKKKALSNEFIDEEADDSDGGVLVEHTAEHAATAVEAGDDWADEPYEEDFINDGDPFDEGDARSDKSAFITPPPSPKKKRIAKAEREPPVTRVASSDKSASMQFAELIVRSTPPPSPKKKRVVNKADHEPPVTPSPSKRRKTTISEDVIELETSSGEDLEAMDLDDRIFKKPIGVVKSLLPPSLVTRRAASKLPPSASQDSVVSSKATNNKKMRSPAHEIDPEDLSDDDEMPE
ncbi:hypothetical protein C8R44DRAFT_880932 [Mycena epipterygia]|nr:hypothetical protein C8R44DRAFT_880932 [Mycena epipterygia]